MLLPLAFTPFTFFPWHFGKTIIFQIIVEVLVFVYLWYILSFPRKLESSGQVKWFQKFNFLDWSILAFLSIIILTSLTGVNPSNSFWGNQARANGVFTWLHFGAFYFLLTHFFRSHNVIVSPDTKVGAKQSSSFFLIAVIVAAIVSTTILFPNFLPESWRSLSGGGIIGNRAFLAAYLILAIGLLLNLFTKYRNKLRWLFLAASVLFFYAIIDTGNRGALLGIFVGAFFGLILCLFFIRHKKVKIWSAFSIIILSSLFLLFFIFKDRPVLQKYFPSISGFTNIYLSSSTAQTRLLAWQSAWQGIKERPLQGWGWGNYEIIFDKYYNPKFLKYGFTETVWDKPHNWLLEVLDSAGVFGVISYLAILFLAGFYLLKNKIVGRGLKSVSTVGKIILFATLVAYFVGGLFLFETTNSLILWFLILAFISSQSSPVVVISKIAETKNIFFDTLKKVLFFILIFSLYRFNFVPLRSSYFMRQAETSPNINDWSVAAQKALSMPGPFLAENAIFLAEQLTKFDKAGVVSKYTNIESIALSIAKTLDNESKKFTDNLAFPVWAGQVYLVLGEKIDEKYYIEAERSLSLALGIATRKQEVLFLLVRLYLLKHDFVKAIDFAQKAVNVAPDISTSHWFLGLANVASGNRPQGLKSIEKAIELGYSLTVDQKLYVLDLYSLEKNYPNKLLENNK